TGTLEEGLHIRAVKSGAQDYLIKGETSPEVVMRSVLYSLERARLRDELNRHQEDLEASNNRLFSILERNADGVLIVDQNNIIRFCNPAAREILGRSSMELLGSEVWFPIPPGTTECVFNPSSKESRSAELIVGELEWEGEPAFLVSLRDTTERKLMEDRIRNSQKIEALGRLAGGVAHEFNNILAIIGGFNQLVLRSTSSLEDSKPWLRKVDGAVKRGTQLATQLLGFTRQGKYEPEPLSLTEVIEHTIEMVNPTIKRTLGVHTHFEENLLPILGDYSQLESIFVNLFINADDAMEQGGELNISAKSRDITPEEASDFPWQVEHGSYIEVRVTDTGTGMEPEVAEKIFDPFFTTKEPGKGTGLGLANVYGIVKHHGGHILCRSNPGEGTIFTLLFPSCNETAVHLAQCTESEKRANQADRGLVLIVDDEMDILYLLKEMLREIGFESLWATNGVEAVQIFEKSHQNLSAVLLDLRMPVMPGTETFEKIKEISSGVPVILLSGFHKDQEVDQLLEKGASAFIQKPYSLDEIAEVLEQVATPPPGAS
ncbi:response regulator, partial [bacterium]|nr:response regulator [bacterium]